MKSFTSKTIFVMGILVVFTVLSTSFMFLNPTCPINYTGAPRALDPNIGQVRYCTSCHGDYARNAAGGSVTVTGLPTGTYVPGMVYDFSLNISHAAANRSVWGFAIKAVNIVDNYNVGTMSTTNANASVKGTLSGQTIELSHEQAAVTGASNSYTYTNLRWTAPATPGANDDHIRFYITGAACNGDESEGGDYIYTNTVDATLSTLPLILVSLNAQKLANDAVQLTWQVNQEDNIDYFIIESSRNDSFNWATIATIHAFNHITGLQQYTYTDHSPASTARTYYRIKIVDKTGAFKYSSVKMLLFNYAGLNIANLSAQPLAARTNARFKIESLSTGTIKYVVSDQLGRTLYSGSQTIEQGVNYFEIPGNKIAVSPGVVFIRFVRNGFDKTFRQVIR